MYLLHQFYIHSLKATRNLQPDEHKQEIEWIKAAKQHPKYFELLYNKYYIQIFRFVYKRLADKSISADVCSDVFLKAMVNIQSYEYKGFTFGSWLTRIAINEVNQYFRAKGKVPSISIDEYGQTQFWKEVHEGMSKEEYILISNLMHSLKEDEKEIVELRIFDDKAFKEVGEILQITENNAKVKFYRVIDKLKKLYLEKYHESGK